MPKLRQHSNIQLVRRHIDPQYIPIRTRSSVDLPGVSGVEIYAMLKERGKDRCALLCGADVQLVE